MKSKAERYKKCAETLNVNKGSDFRKAKKNLLGPESQCQGDIIFQIAKS